MEVADILEAMGEAVGRGAFSEARDIGNTAIIPLGISSCDFILEDLLHETPHSTVHRGHYMGQDVAVKRCRISKASDLQGFRQEVALMSCLDHPGVVRLLAAKATPPDYLAVVPLEVCNLHQKLHELGWRPSIAEVVRMSLQLAEACAHVHSKGIVHRDIKTANILMGRDGAIKLTDFGIAELATTLAAGDDDQTVSSHGTKPSGGFHKRTMVGTLEYMAPEVLLKQPGSFASDVYAFGVTVNELASGEYPFSNCTRDNPKAHTILDMGYGRQELATAVVGEGLRPLLPAGLPAALQILLECCWAADPQQRPSFDKIAAQLRRIQADLEVEPAPLEHGRLNTKQQQPHDGAEIIQTVTHQPIAQPNPVENGTVPIWDQPPWAIDGVADSTIQVSAGAYATAGRRGEDAMEDRHILSTGLGGSSQGVLLGVFDGHRGPQAAEFMRQHFEPTLLWHWARAASADQAMKDAFLEVDAAFRRWHAGATGPQQWAGCTAIVSLVWGNQLFVANAGDCRAVLCRGGAAMPVSRDHTATLDCERQRILDSGGSATWHGCCWRIGSAGLAVTRSIGDADLKAVGVTAEPEVTSLKLRPEDTFLILASDGLWDVVSNYDAVGLVHDTVKQPIMCAERLVTEALTRGSKDNITAVVAFLQPVDTLEIIYSGGRQKYAATRTHYGSRSGF